MYVHSYFLSSLSTHLDMLLLWHRCETEDYAGAAAHVHEDVPASTESILYQLPKLSTLPLTSYQGIQ